MTFRLSLLSFLIAFAATAMGEDSLQVTEVHMESASKLKYLIKGTSTQNKKLISDSFLTAKAIKKNDRQNFGPDSSFLKIVITSGNKKIILTSWHPLFETNSKLVVTSHGVTSLNGRNREDVIKADTKEYQYFRRTFDAIIEKCKKAAEQGAAANP